MKVAKITILAGSFLISLSALACQIKLINDLTNAIRAENLNDQTSLTLVEGQDGLLGSSKEMAHFTVTTDNGTYDVMQTACAPSHMIEMRASELESAHNEEYYDVTIIGGEEQSEDNVLNFREDLEPLP